MRDARDDDAAGGPGDPRNTRSTVPAPPSTQAALLSHTGDGDDFDPPTLESVPSGELLGRAGRKVFDPVSLMRELYVSGDTEGALAIGALIHSAIDLPSYEDDHGRATPESPGLSGGRRSRC